MEALKTELKNIIMEVIEADLQDTDDFIKNLGVDSMMALEIIAEIEHQYNISIPDDEMTRIRSLNQVYELVVELMALKEAKELEPV